MSTNIEETIEQAANTVGSVWPIHSFVTANPLSGFEDQQFHEAVGQAAELFGGQGYPSAERFREAYENGQIDAAILTDELTEHGYEPDPERHLEWMAEEAPDATSESAAATDRVDDVLTKWLAAFLDEGEAHWPMPNREDGFYAAFTEVARHDRAIPGREQIASLPDDPVDTIEAVLDAHPPAQWEPIFEFHLTALPGWTGFVKQRVADETSWQAEYPITLAGYLAARLTLADLLDAPIAPPDDWMTETDTGRDRHEPPLPDVWLSAWEATYREKVVEAVSAAGDTLDTDAESARPDAQMVFCIDTRSEIIRRHIEAAGDYETHGYAGFFGIPMEYEGYDAEVSVEACPPIVDAQHRIEDHPTEASSRASHDRWSGIRAAGNEIIEKLETNVATAFGFVESTGSGYGLALAARTLVPGRVYDLLERADSEVPSEHEFCEPTVEQDPTGDGTLPQGLTLEERVEYAATAFDLMGWEQFARLVVFAGHASQTANNPFDSSLDCGACAGNPGGPSARVLATICNEEAVRERLRDRGFEIPEDTVFVAGQHNTTTDEVTLYDDGVPESHQADLESLRADLETARRGATAERAESMGVATGDGIDETERRAADWAETRPEWGLAGNAGFVIGPRELTADIDLDGRSFLHSYDWSTDDGEALEAIMAGPMVVTQWINAQYYFSTVDNATYGSGSKITHNPVGNVGVYQGNGGDLMSGLPLQSLMAGADDPHHQPLRLSTVIHAPLDRVTDILAGHEELVELLDNGWLSLTVVDPEQDHRAYHYDGDLEWHPVDAAKPASEQDPTAVASVADD